MAVVLKVIGGKNDGREIAIAVPRFIIGRGETAHLRPASDLVSREHCAIEVTPDKVLILDLDSRNGTFVNGNQLTQPHVARSGDTVRIGRLQFQLMVDPAKAAAKKPKVSGVVDAASRTASAKKSSLEDSITDWLMEGDDEDQPDTEQRRAITASDTIQLNFEETTAFGTPKKTTTEDPLESSDEEIESPSGEIEGDAKGKKKKKEKPKKLPPIPKMQHESSTTAADDVLRKFFNRR